MGNTRGDARLVNGLDDTTLTSSRASALEENVQAIKRWEKATLLARSKVEQVSDWIACTAARNLTEIELSRIALSKAAGADVRVFAQKLITEDDPHSLPLRAVSTLQQVPDHFLFSVKTSASSLT